MAYKAQIEVAVAGLSQVKQLRQDIEFISKNIDKVGKGGRGGRSSKEEVKNQTTLNNLLNSNAVQYGRSLQLQKKGKDIEQEKLKYIDAASEALDGNYKAARELISANRLSNTQKKNELIATEKSTKSQEKSLRVTRQRDKHIHSLLNYENQRLGLQTKRQNISKDVNLLELQGLKTAKLREGLGRLSTLQSAHTKKQTILTYKFAKLSADQLKLEVKKQKDKTAELKKQVALAQRNAPRSPIGGSRYDFGSPAQRKFSGGPSSPLNYQRGQLRPGPRGTGRGRGGGGSVLQSAAISGAFPLLFGQGPLTAAAGAVGGGLGAKFGGQMGGFAGGLAATAAVTAIQQTIAGVASLGQAFNSINPDIDKLVSTLGIAGTEEERRINLIKQTQGAQAALRAVTEEMNNKLGEKAVQNLKEFGKAAQRIGNAFAVLGAKMQAALAPFLKVFADIVAKPIEAGEIKRKAAPLAKNDPQIKALRSQIEAISAQSGGGRGGAKSRSDKINSLKKEITLREKILAQQVEEELLAENIETSYMHLLDSKEKQNALHKAFLTGKYEETKLDQDTEVIVNKLKKVYGDIVEDHRESIKKKLEGYELDKKAYDMAKKIKDAWKGISDEITGSIKDGIKGLIKGTATWADMLNNIADKFLDMALNQALYGSILGSGGTKGGGLLGAIGLFANGGSPPVGKPSIVGEKGPELFVPSSSGKIVPNHELGGGGSVNVTVNVDASGTDVQGDDSQAKQLGTMLSAAVQAELVKQKRPGGLLAGVA